MQKITQFIDRVLIDTYADKTNHREYFLDVSMIPQPELGHFLDLLMGDDTHVRDMVHDAMQKMIDARLPEVEERDRSDRNAY